MTTKTVFEQMTEKFQCPGCVAGSNIKCGNYKSGEYNACESHVLGTFISTQGNVALGMPKGFNRPGPKTDAPLIYGLFDTANKMRIKFSVDKPLWDYDEFNVAVWAMEKDGYFFVRLWLPRKNEIYVDVIKGGTIALTPNAIDVSKFIDEMD